MILSSASSFVCAISVLYWIAIIGIVMRIIENKTRATFDEISFIRMDFKIHLLEYVC